ncbi:MAG: exodeoxyribonuclease large subunit [Fibrobacteres bacterium]|nr:exodeoxyribonuclease large subunit [Fibrobacterota bacterium]
MNGLIFSFAWMGPDLPKHDTGAASREAGAGGVLHGEKRDPVKTGSGNGVGAGSPEPKVFSITQYSRSVERLLKTQVPKIWVKGVITQLNQRGRIAYLTLGEFEEGDARPRAVLEVTLWTSELEVFNLRFSRLPIPLALRVDLKVALLLEANFYVPSGRFQPRVLDIDEKFTIGELTLTRQRILERLHKEGLIRRNKERELAALPLRVGLITAPGSAAYQDFTTVLLNSGFSFRIAFAGAKMQGEATEATVLHALKVLQRLPLDVICLVRGGGAKTDLVYFDSESICRAIAACKVPVLTGIGHEIDNSLADLVAYDNKITPTDCAKFLESMAGQCYGRLAEIHQELTEAWRMECQEGWHGLAQRAAAFKHHWEGRRATEELRFREHARSLGALVRQTLRAEGRRLAVDRIGLSRGPRKILNLQRLRFANRTQAMDHAWRRLKAGSEHALRERYLRLAAESGRLLEGEGERRSQARRLVKAWWTQGVRAGKEALALKDRLIHAADPARMLALGFSLMRTRDGKPIRSISQVSPDEVVVNQLKDGTVESRIISKKEPG